MTIDIDAIAHAILGQAAAIGGQTWTKIKNGATFYVRGYAQALASVATALTSGEITAAQARMHADNARIILMMGITNTSHIVLSQVQKFLNGVLDTVKDAINGALHVDLLS